MYFRDITGQEGVKKQLIDAARKGVLPHAQLFYEQGGTGAFPLALAYARYLNCRERAEGDACGRCPSCLKYDALAHPDLHFVFPIARKEKRKEVCDDYLPEWRLMLKSRVYFNIGHWLEYIDPGNSQVQIFARESGEIMRKLGLRIYEADYRVLLVWLPERLHPTCANKLLKMVEEPPENTVILMVSEEPDKVLGTILSRTQRLNIRPVRTEEMADALVKNEKLEPEAARQVAHLAGGNYIRAMELISVNEENHVFLEHFKEMMRNSWARNVKGMRVMADQLAGIGRERQRNFLAYCQRLIRENFMCRFQSSELLYMNKEESGFALKFAPFIHERNVFELMHELAKAELHIGQNVNARIVFFDLSLRITILIRQ
jgi:DNA polymerase-3 subunit delta'